jgi:hypothetical protein
MCGMRGRIVAPERSTFAHVKCRKKLIGTWIPSVEAAPFSLE